MGTWSPGMWAPGKRRRGPADIWGLSHVGDGLTVKEPAPPRRPRPWKLSEGSDVTVHLWGFLLEGSGVPPSRAHTPLFITDGFLRMS